jgi:CHASE1-domain containing sensor protein
MAFDKPSVPSLNPQSTGVVPYLPLILALTAGLMLTALLFLMVRDWENERTRHSFTEAASARISLAQDNLSGAFEDVESLRDFFVATNFEPGREAVQAFTSPTLARHRWLHALSFNRLVYDDERAGFEKNLQKNNPGFRITERDEEGKLITADKRPEYIAVTQRLRYFFRYGEKRSHYRGKKFRPHRRHCTNKTGTNCAARPVRFFNF